MKHRPSGAARTRIGGDRHRAGTPVAGRPGSPPPGACSTPLLATRQGVELVIGILVYMGAMCPKCAFGTRVTSKRWARCKRCGERVERKSLPTSDSKVNQHG